MRVFASIALLLALPLFGGPASGNPPLPPPRNPADLQYVHNYDEFALLMELHIARLEPLVMDVLDSEEFGPRFRNVTRHLMRAKIRRHDREKFEGSTLEELYAYYAYDVFPHPSERNNPNYQYKHPMTAEQRRYGRELIGRFNARGKQLDEEFFARAGIPDDVAKDMKLLEEIVDLVDRASSEVTPEEMLGKASPVSTWVQDPLKKRIAQYLEKPGRYDRLTGHLNYSRVKASLGTKPSRIKQHVGSFRARRLAAYGVIHPEKIFHRGPCVSPALKALTD
jgi:hypothetical protein